MPTEKKSVIYTENSPPCMRLANAIRDVYSFFTRLNFCFFFILCCLTLSVTGQNNCKVSNNTFKAGEKLTYTIYYHWHFVWLQAGHVTFSVTLKNYYNTPCYYFEGYGATYPKYDWFYKVRDTFSTYLDTASFTSLRFFRVTHEGDTYINNDNVFNPVKHKAYCLSESKSGQYHEDSVNLPLCTHDVLAAIYYTRCLNFKGYVSGDTIPINVYLDAHTYTIRLTYLGTETIASSFGKFKCIKFKASLISGTIFKAGQQMTVWATDDKNRLPIRVEAPIIVGEVRAELSTFANLRNPMKAKIK